MMKAALPASPHSGRTSDQSRLRRSTLASVTAAALARPAESVAGSFVASAPSRRLRSSRVAAPAVAIQRLTWRNALVWVARRPSVSRNWISSVVVTCTAGTNQVSAGIEIPRSANPCRTAGSLRSAAATLALGSPEWPPQAPQS